MAAAPDYATPIIPDDIARKVVLPSGYKRDDIFYPAFKWLRENMPLGVAKIDGYDPLWIVTKHADIVAVERLPERFHSGDENPILADQAGDTLMRSLNNGSIRSIFAPTFMDPPEHGKYRGLVNSSFLPGKIAKLAENIRKEARLAVDHMMSLDGECDFMQDVAHYYPLRILMDFLGVPREDEAFMLKLTQEFFGVHDPEEQREDLKVSPVVAAKQWLAVISDIEDYFQDLANERLKNPKDDFITQIAHTTIDGRPLTKQEANGFYTSLITAGHDTASATSSGGMLGMMRHPDQFEKAKANPGLIPGLVEESVRYTNVVRHFMRSAVDDTELRGQTIKAGDLLMLCYPSGNRDEEVFENPEAFNIERSPNRHVGFGYGPHTCLGQHLARLELRTFFEELLPRLRSIELAGEPVNIETNYVGALKSLPMRFEKA